MQSEHYRITNYVNGNRERISEKTSKTIIECQNLSTGAFSILPHWPYREIKEEQHES